MLKKGIITKIISNKYVVYSENTFIDTTLRGKAKSKDYRISVGDKVMIDIDHHTIEKVLERENFLSRPNVANIDINLIVTSLKKPELSLTLLDKLISITTINKIEPVVVFTKIDLANSNELSDLKKLIKYYKSIGIKVFDNTHINKLKKYLKKKIVSVSGQTGAGKSTLINKMDKTLNLDTNEISEALGRGKHTTRVVELFLLKDFFIIDTPGFSSIDINMYSKEEIKNSFIEFFKYTCKYKDCKHINEDGCNIKNNSNILKSRYDNYLKFIKE